MSFRRSHPPLVRALPLLALIAAYSAWAFWRIGAPISLDRVLISGLAVQAIAYSVAVITSDWRLARQQERPARVSQSVVRTAIGVVVGALGVFTLGIALAFVPLHWAAVVAGGLLTLADALVLIGVALAGVMHLRISRAEANIAQHEYAVIAIKEGCPVLRTRHVSCCTVWYGWDSDHRMAFMAHFDRPSSAKDITNIVNEMMLHVRPRAVIYSYLEGGYRLPCSGLPLLTKGCYSSNTRRQLKEAAASEPRLQFQVTDNAFSADGALPWFKKGIPTGHSRLAIDLSLTPATQTISHEKLCGDKHPRRPFMTKPMLRTDKL